MGFEPGDDDSREAHDAAGLRVRTGPRRLLGLALPSLRYHAPRARRLSRRVGAAALVRVSAGQTSTAGRTVGVPTSRPSAFRTPPSQGRRDGRPW